MCGVAAIVSTEAQALDGIDTMVGRQVLRGPDHEATWKGDGVAMGHNRLSLLDLSETGDQPMEGDRYVISYNGEIYNHQELRSHCVDYRFRGSSDTETVLALVETLGIEGALPKLNGMWAFALWDKVDRSLTMAVDPFAIKPLYIHHSTEFFACASSSAAILPLRPKWKVSPVGMARFFNLGGSTGVWEGVTRMDGGTIAKFKDGNLSVATWYTPTFRPCDDLPALIRDAVSLTARADVPVGIFFSGGIDTTIIASVHRGSRAFHLDGPERSYAQQGAEHFGLDLHVVEPASHRTIEALKDIAVKSGEPSMAGFIPWLVSEQAATEVKACISGNGADELFFGYDRTNDPTQERHTFRDASAYGGAAPKWPAYTLEDDRFPACAQARWLELMYYVQHDLNPTLDAASMCHSLEMRVPFLDVRLVEAALSIPQRVHGRKRILKDMLGSMGLPKTYTDRPKYGFSMDRKFMPLEAYKGRAWREACAQYGMRSPSKLTPRDLSYLLSASAGWKAWHETHKHMIS